MSSIKQTCDSCLRWANCPQIQKGKCYHEMSEEEKKAWDDDVK
jgi:hypothetical protein